MPRYYVQLEPHGFKDEDGEELPGLDAAKRMADDVAADLMRNREKDAPYQSVVVTDITGAVVYEAPLVLR
jgi:hypothetical protein